MRVGLAVGIVVEVVVVVGASVLVGDKVFGAFDTGLLDGLLVMLIVVGGLELGETDDGCDVPTMCCVGAKVGGAIDGGGLAVVGALVGGEVVGLVGLLVPPIATVGELVGTSPCLATVGL